MLVTSHFKGNFGQMAAWLRQEYQEYNEREDTEACRGDQWHFPIESGYDWCQGRETCPGHLADHVNGAETLWGHTQLGHQEADVLPGAHAAHK